MDSFPSRLGHPERRRKIVAFLNDPDVIAWLWPILKRRFGKDGP